MVFTNSFNVGEATALGQDLAYDLRQIYAKIVGEHLEDIALARKADNYNMYFKALEDLHVIVKHKFKHESDEEDYKKLVNKAAEVANKHSNIWLGNAKDPSACAMIEESLREIEMFLYSKIDAANMFGSNKRIEGL